jgi:poly(hydroxyalkanoate) depolymerase family esterase
MRYTLLIACLLGFKLFAQTGWTPVASFGTNPGNLNMYSYAPTALPTNAPLVVVMHGCTQTATQYASESGWNILANQHQFYTVYPEQNAANNSSTCFNWFNYGDQNRGQGEALSIKQMIDYMQAHYSIDASRIYVTGLSAGACMTNVMMACYPDILSKGAVMAGAPFKSATSSLTASNAMYGFVTHTAIVWGDSVRHQNPTFTGAFPKVAIFQGSSDLVVSPNNVIEEVKQWTNVHGADQTADLVQANFNGNSLITKNSYYNTSNQTVVETYTISGMGHGISVDPGTCYQQGGTTGTYAFDENFHSSFWAAYFFNILQAPTVISGSISVTASTNGVVYSVPAQSGFTYTWTVPSGITIVSGQGTNSISVNFGSVSGNISVTETDASACKVGPLDLWVTVGTATNIDNQTENNNVKLFYDQDEQTIYVIANDLNSVKHMKLYTIDGRLIKSWETTEAKVNIEKKLSAGIYIVECEVNQLPIRKKIVID